MANSLRFIGSAGLLTLLMAGGPQAAGFGEDICFHRDSGQLMNCMPLPENCPAGKDSPQCVKDILMAAGNATGQAADVGGGRSVVHTDMTYYFAQYLGFSAAEANTIASYNQATDVAQYFPRDINGRLLADPETCGSPTSVASDCSLNTKPINGLDRAAWPTGGIFYHFHAPFQHEGGSNSGSGLNPRVRDAHQEPMLHHVKRWALGNQLLCTHGLTTPSRNGDYATGLTCYDDKAAAGRESISFKMAILPIPGEQTVTPYIPFVVPHQEQIIARADGQKPVRASEIADYLGADVEKFARIGIYLHSFQDRISHHVCGDQATLVKSPGNAKISFQSDLSNEECTQEKHVLRHAWEAGADQSRVPAKDRTLLAVVNGTFSELREFAARHRRTPRKRLTVEQIWKFKSDMYQALQTSDAKQRVFDITEVGKKYGLQPLPGH